MRRLAVVLLGLLLWTLVACDSDKPEEPKYEWNHGYCSECGGRLMYDSTSDKENYICERCGKKYRFDRVMDKKEGEDENCRRTEGPSE